MTKKEGEMSKRINMTHRKLPYDFYLITKLTHTHCKILKQFKNERFKVPLKTKSTLKG